MKKFTKKQFDAMVKTCGIDKTWRFNGRTRPTKIYKALELVLTKEYRAIDAASEANINRSALSRKISVINKHYCLMCGKKLGVDTFDRVLHKCNG